MGGRETLLSAQMRDTGGVAPLADNGLLTAHRAGHAPIHSHSHGDSVAKQLSSRSMLSFRTLMGLDRFTQRRDCEGIFKLAAGTNRRSTNPFDLGCVGNWKGFWDGGIRSC